MSFSATNPFERKFLCSVQFESFNMKMTLPALAQKMIPHTNVASQSTAFQHRFSQLFRDTLEKAMKVIHTLPINNVEVVQVD